MLPKEKLSLAEEIINLLSKVKTDDKHTVTGITKTDQIKLDILSIVAKAI